MFSAVGDTKDSWLIYAWENWSQLWTGIWHLTGSTGGQTWAGLLGKQHLLKLPWSGSSGVCDFSGVSRNLGSIGRRHPSFLGKGIAGEWPRRRPLKRPLVYPSLGPGTKKISLKLFRPTGYPSPPLTLWQEYIGCAAEEAYVLGPSYALGSFIRPQKGSWNFFFPFFFLCIIFQIDLSRFCKLQASQNLYLSLSTTAFQSRQSGCLPWVLQLRELSYVPSQALPLSIRHAFQRAQGSHSIGACISVTHHAWNSLLK